MVRRPTVGVDSKNLGTELTQIPESLISPVMDEVSWMIRYCHSEVPQNTRAKQTVIGVVLSSI